MAIELSGLPKVAKAFKRATMEFAQCGQQADRWPAEQCEHYSSALNAPVTQGGNDEALLTAVALAALTGTASAAQLGMGGGSHPTGPNVGAVTHTQAAAKAAVKKQAAVLQHTILEYLSSYYGEQKTAYYSLANYYAATGNASLASTYTNIAASFANAEVSVNGQVLTALEQGN